MNLNLILALFWGVLCVGLFAYPVLNPRGGRLTIGDSGVSFAWVALLFCCYNLARWWMFRLQKRDRDVMDQSSGRRRPRVQERHPEFDFSNDEEKKEGK